MSKAHLTYADAMSASAAGSRAYALWQNARGTKSLFATLTLGQLQQLAHATSRINHYVP